MLMPTMMIMIMMMAMAGAMAEVVVLLVVIAVCVAADDGAVVVGSGHLRAGEGWSKSEAVPNGVRRNGENGTKQLSSVKARTGATAREEQWRLARNSKLEERNTHMRG